VRDEAFPYAGAITDTPREDAPAGFSLWVRWNHYVRYNSFYSTKRDETVPGM